MRGRESTAGESSSFYPSPASDLSSSSVRVEPCSTHRLVVIYGAVLSIDGSKPVIRGAVLMLKGLGLGVRGALLNAESFRAKALYAFSASYNRIHRLSTRQPVDCAYPSRLKRLSRCYRRAGGTPAWDGITYRPLVVFTRTSGTGTRCSTECRPQEGLTRPITRASTVAKGEWLPSSVMPSPVVPYEVTEALLPQAG